MSQRRYNRLVIRSPDARRARALQDKLAGAAIDAVALAGEAATRPAPAGEDLTLIDADGAGAEAFAKSVRRAVTATLAILGLTESAPQPSAAFDGWLCLRERAVLMRRVLDDMRRDGVCREEARARRRTAAALGLPAPPPRPPPRSMSALFVGPPNTAFLAFEHAWRAQRGEVGAAFTSFSAFDQLQEGQFDAAVLNVADDAPAAISLAVALRRNGGLYHLPVLALLANDLDPIDPSLERGAPLLARCDQDFAAPAAWLAEAIGRARERRITVNVLKSVPEPTSPWTGETLIAHLDTLALTHHGGGRALSIAAIRFSAPPTERRREQFRELAGLSARLIRASDSIAMIDDETILIALPCTDEAGATSALTRITGVWEHTALAGDEPGRLGYASAPFEMAPGESGSALLARARRNLPQR